MQPPPILDATSRRDLVAAAGVGRSPALRARRRSRGDLHHGPHLHRPGLLDRGSRPARGRGRGRRRRRAHRRDLRGGPRRHDLEDRPSARRTGAARSARRPPARLRHRQAARAGVARGGGLGGRGPRPRVRLGRAAPRRVGDPRARLGPERLAGRGVSDLARPRGGARRASDRAAPRRRPRDLGQRGRCSTLAGITPPRPIPTAAASCATTTARRPACSSTTRPICSTRCCPCRPTPTASAGCWPGSTPAPTTVWSPSTTWARRPRSATSPRGSPTRDVCRSACSSTSRAAIPRRWTRCPATARPTASSCAA